MERFKNYINGKWVEPKSNKYFQNINPANINDIVGEFPESGQEDVNDAVAAAKAAYEKWSKVPAPISPNDRRHPKWAASQPSAPVPASTPTPPAAWIRPVISANS